MQYSLHLPSCLTFKHTNIQIYLINNNSVYQCFLSDHKLVIDSILHVSICKCTKWNWKENKYKYENEYLTRNWTNWTDIVLCTECVCVCTKYRLKWITFCEVLEHYWKLMQMKATKVQRKEKRWTRERETGRERLSHSIVCFQLNLNLQMVARLINHYYIRMGYFKWVDIVIKIGVMNNVFIHFNAMRSKGIYV